MHCNLTTILRVQLRSCDSIALCRLADVDKPGALKSMFGPFHGTVRAGSVPGSAVVAFPDARSLQEARARFGGGLRGMFRVKNSSAPMAAAAAAGPVQSGSEAANARPGAPLHRAVQRAAGAPSRLESERGGAAAQHDSSSKPRFAVARNPFAFPDASANAGVGVNTQPTMGINTTMPRARRASSAAAPDQPAARASIQQGSARAHACGAANGVDGSAPEEQSSNSSAVAMEASHVDSALESPAAEPRTPSGHHARDGNAVQAAQAEAGEVEEWEEWQP
jgi:hypothetical protein